MGDGESMAVRSSVVPVDTDAVPVPDTDGDSLASIGRRIGALLIKTLIAGSLLGCYSLAATIAELGSRAHAISNAKLIWEIQRYLPLPGEDWLQRLVLPHPDLLIVLNKYYALAHFPATLIFAIWITLSHREAWARVWSALSVMTVLCVTVDAFFPVAPPRLVPSLHMVDTLALYGPDLYGSHAFGDVADQYGAMPSLHFGWSVFVAWGVIRYAGHLRRLRWLAIAHPVLTLAAVVFTANHYWLDCVVAAAFIPVAILIVDRWMRHTSPRVRTWLKRPLIIIAIPISLFGLLNISTLFI